MQKCLVFFLLFTFPLFAQVDEDGYCIECYPSYTFYLDYPLSSRFGADNLLSLYQVYTFTDNYLLKQFTPCVDGWLGKLVRAVELVAVDFPVADITVLAQHEIFGHGARLRYEKIGQKYDIHLPFPYGDGEGATLFSSEKYDSLPLQKQLGIITGGVEATERMGLDLVIRRLDFDSITVQESLLYLLSYHDLTAYVYSLEEGDVGNLGHDIQAYIDTLNTYYQKEVIDRKTLKNRALINFLDPILYTSLRSIWCYWSTGQLETRLPFLYLKPCAFLPGARLHLAPYGLEYQLQSYFLYYNMPGYAYARLGKTQGNTYYGLGVELPSLLFWGDWEFGFRSDLWVQPKLFGQAAVATARFGGRLALLFHYFVSPRASLYCEVGGKTKGFLLAEPLQANFDLKVGFTVF